MRLRKNESISLKLRYPIIVRVTTLISILLLITLLVAYPRFLAKEFLEKEISIEIEQFDIPQTQQFELPPPPSRPSIPVESENEDLADDVTIEETELLGRILSDKPELRHIQLNQIIYHPLNKPTEEKTKDYAFAQGFLLREFYLKNKMLFFIVVGWKPPRVLLPTL